MEIDKIFQKVKKIQKEDPKKDLKIIKKISKKNKKKKQKQKNKLTEDGLKVYSHQDLKLGMSKNTSLCPFDCDCCF